MADQKDLTVPLPVNPGPKALFRSSESKCKNHRSTMSSPVLKESIDVALLEYQRKLAIGTNDSNGAAGAMFKIKGALEFIDELIRLAEAPHQPRSISTGERLDHSV